MAEQGQIRVMRIYDAPVEEDGIRVLVDRLWPRGIKKDEARIDLWAKDLAPTTELRRWFDHDEGKFDEFRVRYLGELEGRRGAAEELLLEAGGRTITLLFGASDRFCNQAVVLREFLLRNC